MDSNLNLSKFWCWQKDCPDYGKMDSGNIVLKERCGNDNRALLKCKTCGHCFSETHGTPFFGLHTPIDEVCRTLAQIPEKGSIRGAARMSGHDKGTICNGSILLASTAKKWRIIFWKNFALIASRLTRSGLIKKRRKTSLSAIRKNTAMSTAWLQSNQILAFFWAIMKERELQMIVSNSLSTLKDVAQLIRLFLYLHPITGTPSKKGL